MIRGTTPLHTFTIPFDTGLIDRVRVIYSQNGQPVLKKDNCTLDGNLIKVKLTQEDTLSFTASYPVDIQVRVVLHDGEALVSSINKVSVEKCLENEVL